MIDETTETADEILGAFHPLEMTSTAVETKTAQVACHEMTVRRVAISQGTESAKDHQTGIENRGPPPESHRDRLAREDREAKEKADKEEQDRKNKLLERQKKVAEWKKKKEAELAGCPLSSGTDVRSPAHVSSPQTPKTREGSHTHSPEPSKPFAGKFDPKAIANRARAKMEGKALDGEVGINGTAEKKPTTNGTIGSSLKSTKSASKAISAGFGITKTDDETDMVDSGPAIDMDDDNANKRKLARIPMADGIDDAVMEDQEDDQDHGDLDEELNGDDEELVAAARAAAERRAAEAMEAAKPAVNTTNGDTHMANNDDDEDVDPLDAYMLELEDAPQKKSTRRANRLLEQELGFDEDGIMDAVGDDDAIDVKAKRKKKEVPTVDHKKVEYEEFRRDFYTEPQELHDMTEEEAKSLRFELDDIKVQGSNVPKPVQKFAQLGLGSQVLDIIRGLGFEKPTCIQAQAIPAIMSGRDVIGVAKTGSGKTVAFLLPMFRHIKDQRPLENMEGPVGLILAPTRELATQIHKECKPYLKALNLRACCAYGGAPITEQIADLKRGAEIVVSTPGRLIDLLAANSGRVINLRRVTYVVMDEADRMFDMGFEPQVQKILSNVRPDKQCVLFSATFPRKMEGLARKELKAAVQITVGGRSTVPKEITQVVKVVKEEDKMSRLLEMIGNEFQSDDDKRCLVFVERQETADVLLGKLQRVGYPCVSVHGGREQIDRDQALEDFKAGNVPIMIATSVAARGLDVKQLTLVINFDVPSHLEDYVHRAGRTGRAGNLGTAATFITPDQERFSLDIVKALKQSETHVPDELQKMADGFEARIKEGTAKRYGGFGGHGLERIQAQHDAELARQRRAFRTEGEADEEEEEKKKEKEKEPPHEDEIKVYAKNEEQPAPPPKAEGIVDVDSEIKVERMEKISLPANTGGSRLDRAAAAAALINSRLGAHGTARAGASIDNRGPDAGEFHYKLEINDFPQKARWAVTNRTNVAKILESTGVSITTKGRYYKTGEEPGVGDLPKMNVLIEGDTEPQVISAVRELRRLLNEAVAMDGGEPSKVGGRYTVV
ncbi:Pre-mRNA-processing ATP-dependent RNA helicase prp5-like protein [Elsinoe fawcettii]|nr:Pre-mRNA-processing ATP-dependent RNA helicase prp5-like protein [Elsinoe fawcettii]